MAIFLFSISGVNINIFISIRYFLVIIIWTLLVMVVIFWLIFLFC